MTSHRKNLIGITIGDPKGIGPEVVAKAWSLLTDDERKSVLVYGDRAVLDAAEELARTMFDHKQLVITSSVPPPVQNIEDIEAARVGISAVDAAIEDALKGRIAAIVTAPVGKHRIRLLKPGFTGHTEYLAKAARAKEPVMMFARYFESEDEKRTGSGLGRVSFSLVTTHLPIRDVADAITTAKVLAAIRKTHVALKDHFHRQDARIAVMSLNPHAGENGSLGTEEKTAIIPAIKRALKEGINCHGPFAADGLFRKTEGFDFDAIVAMYHDQALIPAKMVCGAKCVNITLGLPFVRTSPGHGTAEDIAWLGNADESGMTAAIKLAMKFVVRRTTHDA